MIKNNDQQHVWISEREAQALLNVKRTTLYKLRKNGVLVYSKPTARKTLYLKSSIEELIAKNSSELYEWVKTRY